MKVCDKCGAYNGDERRFCVDCGETLGEPLPEREAALVEDQIGNNMERLYTRTDPLAVTLFDKVFGWICLVGLAALLALLIIDLVTERRCDYPEGYLYGLLFFAVGALDAFVPKVTWSLEKLRLSWWVNSANEAEPSDMYLLSRRVGIVLLAVLGLLVLLVVGHGLFFAQQSGFFPDWVGLTPDESEISYRIIG